MRYSDLLYYRDKNTWQADGKDGPQLQLSCEETVCEFTLLDGLIPLCTANASIEAKSLILPCKDSLLVAFIARTADLPTWAQGNPVPPSAKFNFFRVGPIYSEDNQMLAHVAPDKPIYFAVDSRVASNTIFTKSFFSCDSLLE